MVSVETRFCGAGTKAREVIRMLGRSSTRSGRSGWRRLEILSVRWRYSGPLQKPSSVSTTRERRR